MLNVDEIRAAVGREYAAGELGTVAGVFGQPVKLPGGRNPHYVRMGIVFAHHQVAPGRYGEVVAAFHQVRIVGFHEQFQLPGIFALPQGALLQARGVAKDLAFGNVPTVRAGEVQLVAAKPHALPAGKTGGPVGKPTVLQCCVDVKGTPASGGGGVPSSVKSKGKGVKPSGKGGGGPEVTLKGRVKIRHTGLKQTLDARNITLLLFSGNRATIEGTGELNGEDGHTFRIVVEDRAGGKDAVVQVIVDGVAWPTGDLKQGKFHVKPQ